MIDNDLISRSALIKRLEGIYKMAENEPIKTYANAIRLAIGETKLAPTVETVQHGRWIDRGDYITTAYGSLDMKVCSNCNAEVTLDGYDYYFPNCGAKMDAEVDT